MSEEVGYSDITKRVMDIVTGYFKAGTKDPLHDALRSIMVHCDDADYYGDDIETDDIRKIVERKLNADE